MARLLFWLIIASAATLALRGQALLVDKPFIEDAFYALSVSRHLALGHGLTIDGVHTTNGFQPLFVLLCAPLFASGDRLPGLRLVLLFSTAIFAATALLAGTIARDAGTTGTPRDRFWLGALFYAGSAALFMQHHNGLETGVLLCAWACALRFAQQSGLATLRHCFVLGVILGLTVLARVDAAVVVAVWALCEVLDRSRPLPTRLARAAAVSGTAFLVSLPWWLYNLRFGSLVPSSGRAEAALGLGAAKLWAMAGALSMNLTPSLFFSRFEGAATLAVRCLLLAALLRAGLRAGLSRRIVLGLTALAVIYAGTSGATHFFHRYLAPLSLLAVVATSTLLSGRRWALPLAALLALQTPAAVGLAWSGHGFRGNTMFREQLPLVERLVPADAPVAALQSGTLGFFRERVVNLDGKVNAEVLSEPRASYLQRRGLDWFCDWDFFTDDPAERARWRLAGQEGQFKLFQRN